MWKVDFIGSSEKRHVVRFDWCYSPVSNGDSGCQQADSDDDDGENSKPHESAARRRHVLAHLPTYRPHTITTRIVVIIIIIIIIIIV